MQLSEFQKICLQIAKNVILKELGIEHTNNNALEDIEEPDLQKQGACFVTLKKNGELRGCIGTIMPHRTLIEDIKMNARNAAFEDPRFSPLIGKEIHEKLNIGITILSPMQEKTFIDPSDLFSFLNREQCGLVIKLGRRQATFLPSVREELPTAKEFISHLLQKAGIEQEELQDHFSAFEFQIYYGEEFKEDWDKI